MKKAAAMLLTATLSISILAGCGKSEQPSEDQQTADTRNVEIQATAQTTEIISPEDEIASYTVKDLDLNDVALADYVKGNKLTMINIWGTFCGPCISEMPALGEIERRYKDKGFEIVGLTCDVYDLHGNYNESVIADARAIIEDTGITYPVLIAPTQLMLDIGLQYVPTTYFLDSEGNVLGNAEIGSKTSVEWEDVINMYLSQE
jgi:thiol-disulfide isomerase/thioredoxin